MSLTKQDLQAIGELMDARLQPIQSDVSSLKADVSSLKTDMAEVKKDIREHNKRLAVVESFEKPINAILDSQIDTRRNIDELKQRMDRVEDKLDGAVVIKVAAPAKA